MILIIAKSAHGCNIKLLRFLSAKVYKNAVLGQANEIALPNSRALWAYGRYIERDPFVYSAPNVWSNSFPSGVPSDKNASICPISRNEYSTASAHRAVSARSLSVQFGLSRSGMNMPPISLPSPIILSSRSIRRRLIRGDA